MESKTHRFNLSKAAQENLRARGRRNRTPENSFFVMPKTSRPYDKEYYENMQFLDPRSPYRE